LYAPREKVALYCRHTFWWLRGNDIDADNSAIRLRSFYRYLIDE